MRFHHFVSVSRQTDPIPFLSSFLPKTSRSLPVRCVFHLSSLSFIYAFRQYFLAADCIYIWLFLLKLAEKNDFLFDAIMPVGIVGKMLLRKYQIFISRRLRRLSESDKEKLEQHLSVFTLGSFLFIYPAVCRFFQLLCLCTCMPVNYLLSSENCNFYERVFDLLSVVKVFKKRVYEYAMKLIAKRNAKLSLRFGFSKKTEIAC